MTDYKTLFEQAHQTPPVVQPQNQLYPIDHFPRTDLFYLYIRTKNNIDTNTLREKLEDIIGNPFDLEYQAHHCIMYIFPSEITNQFPKAQQLQQHHWQQHALFIRGATNPNLKQAAQDKIRDQVAQALDELSQRTLYKDNITWRGGDLAHRLLDPYEILQQHDPQLAELEYHQK